MTHWELHIKTTYLMCSQNLKIILSTILEQNGSDKSAYVGWIGVHCRGDTEI